MCLERRHSAGRLMVSEIGCAYARWRGDPERARGVIGEKTVSSSNDICAENDLDTESTHNLCLKWGCSLSHLAKRRRIYSKLIQTFSTKHYTHYNCPPNSTAVPRLVNFTRSRSDCRTEGVNTGGQGAESWEGAGVSAADDECCESESSAASACSVSPVKVERRVRER